MNDNFLTVLTIVLQGEFFRLPYSHYVDEFGYSGFSWGSHLPLHPDFIISFCSGVRWSIHLPSQGCPWWWHRWWPCFPPKPPKRILDSTKMPIACQKVIVLTPNIAGSRLFQRSITTLPKTNTPAVMAIGMKMARLIQKFFPRSFPQHLMILIFNC